MMKGQRERYTIGGEEKAIIVWQQEGGKQEEKRLGAFFAFDEALESLVSIPSTHTLMSPESQDITARTPESDLGKKSASIFQKTDHGDESMADMINMSPITKCAIF